MTVMNQMYIDGVWRPAADGNESPIIDPATEQTVGSIPMSTIADVDLALAAADRGFQQWRAVDAWTRSAKLRSIATWVRENVDEMAALLTEEQGKTLVESKGEISAAADQFDWYADEARRIYGRVVDGHSRAQRLFVLRQPIGPVAALTPWNFPVLLAARKIAPALAAGCSIIVKPDAEAPRAVLCLARACEEAEIEPGVVNIVTGNPALISNRLIESDVIRKVSLTGSVPVGKEILRRCAEVMKPASMELGGHSPVLVFEDADIEHAAEIVARAKFRNNGQVCIAASRFYVQSSVAERFTERFVEVVRSLKLGDGRDPQTDVGPLANRRRRDAIEELVADAVDKGATVCCGGRRPQGFDRGFYYEPTVLQHVRPDMKLMSDEPFGPVAPISTFDTLDDAIERANDTPFGLAAYVFTNNLATAHLASERLEAGMVGVNNLVIATAEAPFGGIKQSGFGREGGSEWADAYTVTKYINMLL